jgi:hypothetical protein
MSTVIEQVTIIVRSITIRKRKRLRARVRSGMEITLGIGDIRLTPIYELMILIDFCLWMDGWNYYLILSILFPILINSLTHTYIKNIISIYYKNYPNSPYPRSSPLVLT